jgi:hypothetical protein
MSSSKYFYREFFYHVYHGTINWNARRLDNRIIRIEELGLLVKLSNYGSFF